MIEMPGERGSGRSVLAVLHDDDDDIYIYIYVCREREREGGEKDKCVADRYLLDLGKDQLKFLADNDQI